MTRKSITSPTDNRCMPECFCLGTPDKSQQQWFLPKPTLFKEVTGYA